MTWLSFAIALLKLVNAIMTRIDREQLLEAGRNEVIAQTMTSINEKLGVVKQIRERIDAMSDGEVDSALRELESRRVRNKGSSAD